MRKAANIKISSYVAMNNKVVAMLAVTAEATWRPSDGSLALTLHLHMVDSASGSASAAVLVCCNLHVPLCALSLLFMQKTNKRALTHTHTHTNLLTHIHGGVCVRALQLAALSRSDAYLLACL